MFVAFAAVFLIGALISYVGLFDQVENTTTLLAGASTGFDGLRDVGLRHLTPSSRRQRQPAATTRTVRRACRLTDSSRCRENSPSTKPWTLH